MILESVFNLFFGLLELCFKLVPALPDFPDGSLIDTIFNMLVNSFELGAQIVSFFLPSGFLPIMIPLFVCVMEFDLLYGLVLWLLRKIPFVGIK